ncbi:MAG: hypothetical protein ABFR95_01065 [Actinomycetota bacterium]
MPSPTSSCELVDSLSRKEGRAEAESAWWLNLQAHPDAIVDLAAGQRRVMERLAEGASTPR